MWLASLSMLVVVCCLLVSLAANLAYAGQALWDSRMQRPMTQHSLEGMDAGAISRRGASVGHPSADRS